MAISAFFEKSGRLSSAGAEIHVFIAQQAFNRFWIVFCKVRSSLVKTVNFKSLIKIKALPDTMRTREEWSDTFLTF